MYGSTPITVLVGPSEKSYTVHKDFMTSASLVFSAMLNGNFIEGNEGRIKLPEEDPYIFDHIVAILYRGVAKSDVDIKPVTIASSTGYKNVSICVRLYIALDKYQLNVAKNEVIDVMRAKMKHENKCFNNDTIAYIYNETTHNSPLRKYAASLVAFRAAVDGVKTTEFRQLIMDYPEFGFDVITQTPAMVKKYARKQEANSADPRLVSEDAFYDMQAVKAVEVENKVNFLNLTETEKSLMELNLLLGEPTLPNTPYDGAH
jgi:hypothetical protein